MLDKLMQLAKDQIGDQIKTSNNLDDNQRDEVFNIAQSGMLEGIKNQINSGNIGGLLAMFNGNDDPNDDANPLNADSKSNAITSLMEKLGIDQAKASVIAAQIIPVIMNKFADKETGTADNAGDLIKKIGLDGDNGIMDKLKSIGGGGLGDLFSKFTK